MDSKQILPLVAASLVGAGLGAASLWVALSGASESAELRKSKSQIAELQARLEAFEPRNALTPSLPAKTQPPTVLPAPPSKRVRVYVDGCFDLMHFGHANALRQARALGDCLVVGLVGDADIIKNKGSPPVMPEDERFLTLQACKFVDEIIRDAPYDLSPEWVDSLVRDHAIDYVVHGDDPCITADGKDAYAYAKSIGRYRQFKRTEGVSTTDIVGRMLLMTREHHVPSQLPDARAPHGVAASATAGGCSGGGAGGAVASPVESRRRGSSSLRSSALAATAAALAESYALDPPTPPRRLASRSSSDGGGVSAASPSHKILSSISGLHAAAHSSRFLPTARRIMQFAEGRVPRPADRVVYMCGGFDLFNAGHVAALQAARECGDFLLVGVHDDATINEIRGHGLPVLNLYERTLSLLACKYVDEVIIGAPWEITSEMISSMNIAVVVKGSVSDMENADGHLGWHFEGASQLVAECYAVPRALGLLREIPSPRSLTSLDIIDRILLQRDGFQRRYEKKSVSEAAYVRGKAYVPEG